MKANELAINDWVYSIVRKENWCLQLSDFARLYEGINLTDNLPVRPILLTLGILEKNKLQIGENVVFEEKTPFGSIKSKLCIEHIVYSLQPKGKFECWTIQITHKELNVFEGGHLTIRLRHVHELQHALRLFGLNKLADNFKV